MQPSAANQEIYDLLKNGVRVSYATTAASSFDARAGHRLARPAQQRLPARLAVVGLGRDLQAPRRPGGLRQRPAAGLRRTQDSAHSRIEDAYEDNLRDYKDSHPAALLVQRLRSSSPTAAESRIGSVTRRWEHFAEWKRINEESEEGVVSLETMIRGTCEPDRLLDLVENFTLFEEARAALVKIVGKNHQYLGVNNAFDALCRASRTTTARLGVFWHTQGSGKSFSMVFFAQKVLRKLPGNWTFVIVTDRHDLDDQIYKNFASAGAVTERKTVRPTAGSICSQLLSEDHRYVFTLIQKFRTETAGSLSHALGPRRHHRDDRRGPPQPVRHAGPEHAQRPAQRGLHRLHRHAADGGRGEDARGLRRLRQRLQLQAVDRGRRDRPAVLREPHPRAPAPNENLNDDMEACSKRRSWTRSRSASWSASSPASTT